LIGKNKKKESGRQYARENAQVKKSVHLLEGMGGKEGKGLCHREKKNSAPGRQRLKHSQSGAGIKII